MLTGKPLSERDAQRVGLVDYLVERSDWPRAVHRLGPMLALTTAAPFRGAKKLLNESAPQRKMQSTVYPRMLRSGGTQTSGNGTAAAP
jgi:enoyl-CoA hydratase/carnithine racemase